MKIAIFILTLLFVVASFCVAASVLWPRENAFADFLRSQATANEHDALTNSNEYLRESSANSAMADRARLRSDAQGSLIFAGLIGFCGSLYFLPTWLSLGMKRPNYLSIFILNFFTGWTFFGWVASLVWSVNVSKAR